MAAETHIGPRLTIAQDSKPADDWPTYHKDMLRSGYDPAFPNFTTASLHWKSTTLDGNVYAEPLIVGTAVIVATERNSLYELNAITGQTVWHINLGTPVNGGVLPCGDINPSGITGTPVIDAAEKTVFVVAFLSAPSLHHELFALDLDTGHVKFSRPIDPSTADPTVQQQRAALTLSNGYVYVAYGGLDGDCGQYHGWLTASKTDGTGPLISYMVPTGREGAIWGGGDGPVVDSLGNLFVATGNGEPTSTFDFGDAVIKLSAATTGSIRELDYFAPNNWAALDSEDLDLGSTEPRFLNSTSLFQIGKQGVGYVLNATSLGRIGGQLNETQVCNDSGGAFGGLAYASPYLVIPCDNGLVTLKINFGSGPPYTVAWRGPGFETGPPIIAGNAVWDVDVSDGLIDAFNLTNGQQLFQDTIGIPPTHFNSVSAGDGQIFVSKGPQVRAYVPLPPQLFVTPQTPQNGTASGSGYPTLLVKVTNPNAAPVAGANVTIYVNGIAICTSVMSSTTGVAFCAFEVTSTGTYYWNGTAQKTGFRSAVAPQTTFTLTAGPVVYQIPLEKGWNLISIPIVPANAAIGTVLGSQVAGGNITVVWSYQNGKWLSSTFSGGKLSGSLTAMQDGFGYWIYMTKPDNLFVVGSIFPLPPATLPGYTLAVGWNLVGFKPQPAVGTETVGTYLSSITGNINANSVWVYDNPSGSWIRVDPSYVLHPGQALWVLVTTSTILRP